ncbi:MAG: S8 family serine peptidase [Planctomycetota bacterium]
MLHLARHKNAPLTASTALCLSVGMGISPALAEQPALIPTAVPAPAEADFVPLVTNLRDLSLTPGVGNGYHWNNDDVYLTYAGSVAPQGDPILGTDTVRTNLGLTGSGITIGIISDSFNALGGASAGIASGDLPGAGNPLNSTPVTVLNEDFSFDRIDEGRAMAEIIHDIAPGANLLFHSAFNNGGPRDTTIATAIDNLRLAGADIIVDDVAILTTPFFQDGAAAQAANTAAQAGIGYYSSAGNSANDAHQGTFSGQAGDAFNFSSTGTDTLLDFVLPDDGNVRITLQWSNPFPSVSGAYSDAEAADFDFAIFDSNGTPVAFSGTNQNGISDPVEFIDFTNTSGGTESYVVRVDAFDGPVDGALLKLLFIGDADVFDDDFSMSPTVFGQPGAEGAVAIGAQVFDPASFGVGGSGPNEVNSFSSEGPVLILFDEDGNPVSLTRPGAELVGPDAVNTTFFGDDIDDIFSSLENDTFPNFLGTSAAAPHIAAVAALLMEQANNQGLDLTFDDINQILFDTAVDLESPGFDDLSGWGRVDAIAASQAIAAIPEPTTLVLFTAGLGSLLLRRRR